MSIKPMLGSGITDFSKLTFPKLVSPKLDGIFCIINNGVVVSRSGKPIRSKYVQELFGKQEYNNLSGELIYGEPTAKDCFNLTTQFCMSETVKDTLDPNEIMLFVFDYVDDELVFTDRNVKYKHTVDSSKSPFLYSVPQVVVESLDALYEEENNYLEAGYEGAMLRNPTSMYKHGRATEKSQDLLKLKRFSQSECIVIGFQEKMTNTNEQKRDEFGYAERSTSKEGMLGADTLGAFLCKDIHTGVEFSMGSGLDDAKRREVWENREEWIGKILTYKSFLVGVKDAPRFPIFLGESATEFIGVRHEDDMDAK